MSPEPNKAEAKAASDPFVGFAVKDLISKRSNHFGGGAIAHQLSAGPAKGAVFVVNGDWLLRHTPWRELLRTVRIAAEAGERDDERASVSQLLDSFPAASDFDQTALQTSQEVDLEARVIRTPEYEGVLLWNLRDPQSGESSEFMHG